MKNNFFRISLLSLLSLLSYFGHAQDSSIILSEDNKRSLENNGVVNCYTVESEEMLRQKHDNLASKEEFENWIQPKIKSYKRSKNNTINRSQAVRTIPIIFHVLSDGSGVDNVSQALINAQIAQLNLDFRNQSASPIAVSADSEIEFCAARQSPIGQNLTQYGINRITTFGDGPFSPSDFQNSIKAQTQWDPTKYFNVWVAPLSGTLLGYAQFPEASSLAGIGTGNGIQNTDGVVITSFSVGSKNNPNPASSTYGTGITLTHEIGHWLGLRHTWGDGPCGVDDFCADTPESDSSNFGCSASGSFSCGSPDMIQNYMDYTSDACKNTFTADQAARMNVVLNSSPRRMELVTTSDVCNLAPVYNIDSGIEIQNLNNPDCTTTIEPELKITNLGVNTLTSATIQYTIDFVNTQTINWTGNLLTNQSEVITLPIEDIGGGFHSFLVSIINPNGSTDEELDNNEEIILFTIDAYDVTSLVFELKPDNFGSQITWEFKNSLDQVLYSGGPYTNGNTSIITQSFDVTVDDCYTFNIYDSNDDGICCTFGNGFYTLKTGSGQSIVNGSDYGGIDTKKIQIGMGSLSTTDFFSDLEIILYPNPVNDFLQIKITDNNLPDRFEIFNVLGQKITENNILTQEDLLINTSQFSNGLYFIRLEKNNQSEVFRFIKK